jgi:hypothetical protein
MLQITAQRIRSFTLCLQVLSLASKARLARESARRSAVMVVHFSAQTSNDS